MEISPSENQILSEILFSATESPPNKYGVRGLDGNVDEWVIIDPLLPSQRIKESK